MKITATSEVILMYVLPDGTDGWCRRLLLTLTSIGRDPGPRHKVECPGSGLWLVKAIA